MIPFSLYDINGRISKQMLKKNGYFKSLYPAPEETWFYGLN